MRKSVWRIIRTVTALVLLSQLSLAQTISITANPGTSGNIVVGGSNYHVSESLYTEAEIGASNFTTSGTAINHIDFNVATVGTGTSIANFRIYLRTVPLTTTTYTTGVYSTAGYTQVFNGTFDASVTDWVGVDLTTPFVRTSGTNLEVLIERFDNVVHTGYVFRSANGNETSATVLSSRRLNTATQPVSGTTVLNTTTAFRPQIQFKHTAANDAAVDQVYTLGKLPVPFATPHLISANVFNNGSNPLTNLNVTLNITGANTFTDTKTVASLAPGASAQVTFAAFNPTATGNNTVVVSVPSDDFANNNSFTVNQEVTANAYSYAYSTTPSGAVGLNGVTGDFVAMFTTSSPTSVNQVGVTFNSSGLPFQIGIWDKSGSGFPGALLWESTVQTSSVGVFTLPITPAVNITDTFYIGVRQIGTTNIQFSYQQENPIRPGTFFYTSPTGSTTWTDFAPGNPFRFMIEPRLTMANDVGVASINYPVGASIIDNCGIVPQAVVSNFGSNDQTTPFDVTFQIKQNGSVLYSNTQSVSLNSGESSEVTFTPFNGSVTGTDSAYCFTSLATDAAANNNTVSNRFSTGSYSYGGGTVTEGLYSFANSTPCASPSPFQPVYNWITETTDEVNWGSNGDDSVLATPITLPFSFTYFGNTYTQFWICSNGWISFTDPSTLAASVTRTPELIPTAGGLENYIAGYLADLDLTAAVNPDAHVYYGGDATQFVITFEKAHLWGSATDYITFQIILKPDGNIYIQYNYNQSTLPVPSSIQTSASAGIENAAGDAGILYRYVGNLGPQFSSPLAVQFRPASSVPVTLISFTARKQTGYHQLNWTTSQEVGLARFVIERSSDGRNFIPVGTITASGNSFAARTYSFDDRTPLKGRNSYRIRMEDADGRSTFSEVRTLSSTTQPVLLTYPSPVKNQLQVQWNGLEASGTAELRILDIQGTIKLRQLVRLDEFVQIDMRSLPTGVYLVQLNGATFQLTNRINKL